MKLVASPNNQKDFTRNQPDTSPTRSSGRRVILASASETAQGVPTLVKPFKPDDLKQLVAQVLKNA